MNRARLLLLSLVLAAACSKPKPGPDEILRRYTDATLHGRVEEAWPLLSAKDRAYRPLSAMQEAAKQLEQPNAKTIIAKTRFEITAVKVEGDRATVTQKLTGPDVEKIIHAAEADPANAEKVRSLPPAEAMAYGQKLLADALASPGCPMAATEQTLTLVREGGEWKVVADFEAHDRRERAKDPLLRDLQGQPPE